MLLCERRGRGPVPARWLAVIVAAGSFVLVSVAGAAAVRPDPGNDSSVGPRASGGSVRVVIAPVTDAAKRKRAKCRKLPKTRIAYTLSVQLKQTYELRTVRDSMEVQQIDQRTSFLGNSSRFWLVNRGKASAPQYEIQPVGKPLGALVVRGSVSFLGLGFSLLGWPPVCRADHSLAIAGGNGAVVEVFLLRNRFRRLSITSQAVVMLHSVGCSADVTSVWPMGPVSSPTNPRTAAFPTKLGSVNPKGIRFGRPFTLVRLADPGNDPALHYQSSGGGATSEQSWFYDWRLKFTPVKRR